jgi:nickel transport protein
MIKALIKGASQCQIVSGRCWIKGLFGFMSLAVFLSLAAGPVRAHKVMIFAWVEGDTVHTESKFSGGKTVKRGKIIVYDLEGNQLVEGNTDKQGRFSFSIPKKTTLKVVLNAGMGHRAEWTIPVEETDEVISKHSNSGITQETSATVPKKERESIPECVVSAGEIQIVVEKALDKKIEPIMNILAESCDQGPSVTDILGGIGYILGLVGIGTYFHYRRRSRETVERNDSRDIY